MFQQQRNIWNFGRPSIEVRKDPYPLMQFSARCPRAWLDPLFWATPRHPPCFQVFWTFAHPPNFELLRPKLFILWISGLDPVPPPNLDAGATPLLEGSVVGGEVRAKYFQEISKYLKMADYESILRGWNVLRPNLLPRAQVRVQQAAQQGTRWSQRPASREETFPHLPWCVFFAHLSLPASNGRVALSFNVRRPVVPPWWHFLLLLLLFLLLFLCLLFCNSQPRHPLTHLSCFCCYFFFIIQFSMRTVLRWPS